MQASPTLHWSHCRHVYNLATFQAVGTSYIGRYVNITNVNNGTFLLSQVSHGMGSSHTMAHPLGCGRADSIFHILRSKTRSWISPIGAWQLTICYQPAGPRGKGTAVSNCVGLLGYWQRHSSGVRAGTFTCVTVRSSPSKTNDIRDKITGCRICRLYLQETPL